MLIGSALTDVISLLPMLGVFRKNKYVAPGAGFEPARAYHPLALKASPLVHSGTPAALNISRVKTNKDIRVSYSTWPMTNLPSMEDNDRKDVLRLNELYLYVNVFGDSYPHQLP